MQPSFWGSVKDAANNIVFLVIAILAGISLIPQMIVDAKLGWIQPVFIVVALFISIILEAWTDHTKDSKFVELQHLNLDEDVPVLRGKRGQTQTISVWNLLVGDIINLQPGDKIPADCLVLESANLTVSEVTRVDDDDEDVSKITYTDLAKNKDHAPFLYADSFVKQGICKALVCCVGEHSSRGIIGIKHDVSDQQTELKDKLGNIGGSIKFFALIASLSIFVCSLIVLFIQKAANSTLEGDAFTAKLCENSLIAVVMLIVVIPEGLEMTVEVSLAHSVLLMSKYDNVLVRDVASVEECGQITELCLGKTGTMTTEQMEVVNFYTQDIFVKISKKDTFLNCDLDPTIMEKIVESVVYNSQAFIEMTENSFYVPVGNGTEVSLIKWLQNAEIPVHERMAEKDGRVLAQVPFNSKLKRSVIAVQHPGLEDTVRVYVKGAPEVVLQSCSSHYQPAGQGTINENDRYWIAQKVPLDENARHKIINETMEQQMAQNSLRVIAFSYCDMSVHEFQQRLQRTGQEIDNDNEIASIVGDQTFLALVALRDPLRMNIKDVIKTAESSGINLRLISGDHLLTSKAVARDCGILTKHEFDSTDDNVAMDASHFRSLVGDVVKSHRDVEDGQDEERTYSLSEPGQQKFNRIIGSLKVIGRAEPEDKLRLVVGLRNCLEDEEDENSGRRVAVVGEGINDVEAFEAANVSFAVQHGSSLARNRASMILQTNDFDSCMRAVMWGRNVYLNVQRFLQFQLSCNFAVIVVVFMSQISMTQSCLNATQLIWINLIMDILGALALASTRPQTDIATYRAGEGNIMTGVMYRQIFGLGLFQLLIMCIVMWPGKNFFNVHYLKTDMPSESAAKREHFTLIFNTFIWLQVFNLINCRDVSAKKMHGFTNLHTNLNTWVILAIIIGVQVLACFDFLKVGTIFFLTTSITGREFAVTVVCAASILAANALLKLVPERWVSKMPSLDESKSIGAGSKLVAGFNKAQQHKAYNPNAKKQQEEVHSQDSQENDDEYRNV